MARLLEEELTEGEFEPIEYSWEEEKASATFLADRARSLLTGEAALGSDLPVGAGVTVVEGALAACRYQLTPPELERFRQLGVEAGEVVGGLLKGIEPGLTEQEVARSAAAALAARGIRAVVNLVAADERLRKFRHPVPTERRWEKVLMLVVCARRGGLIVSLSRIICAGAAPEELLRRTEAAAAVNAALLAATRPGATGAALSRTAARAYAAAGHAGEERLHHQGGAAGYRTRDWVAHPASTEVVRPGQAFAWNPSVTGTKVEETIVAHEDGVEVVTATPDWPQLAVAVGGREYFSPGVLSI
jgi:Xaa-Pro aminopeptidase